ncbi:MAG TPA: methionyl-tRNA formyltransferase [Candidatus Aquilonibacter sp.]|nr:methionyl-tRNA formyltransferase [Candidatus Aquilonibacter sp.]
MRLVFCGTPEFAVPTLEALLDRGHDVALVLTQPDRPAGRRMELQQSAVKRAALARGLRVLQPEKIRRNEELRSELESIRPDAIIVVAYGRIIPDWMLTLPRFGNINLHGSLLPRYRGAAPIQWAVANGETETGVTTMRLDAGLDTGDVLLESRIAIGPDTTASELYPQLASVGANLILDTLDGLERGAITPRPQDHSQATLAPILTREDGRMDLKKKSAREAYNRWRGFSPWPGAYAGFRGKRFLVHRMHPAAQSDVKLAPEELALRGGELLAGAADGTALVLDEVQVEGKARMSGAQFAKDFQLRPGERLA